MAVHYRNGFLLYLHKEYCIHDKSKQCLQYAVRKELGEVGGRRGEEAQFCLCDLCLW